MLTLYSTWGCHLCDDAAKLLSASGTAGDFKIVDIVDDEQMFSRYRVRIPVLVRGDKELDWPFDAAKLSSWLEDTQ